MPDQKQSYPNDSVNHENRYQLFIGAVAGYSLILIVLYYLLPQAPAGVRVLLLAIINLLTFIFLFDFIRSLYRAPAKSEYFFRQYGWIDLLGSIPFVPLLSLFRIVRIIRIRRSLRKQGYNRAVRSFFSSSSESTLIVTIFAVVIVLTLGSIFVLYFEEPAVGASIKSGGEALWWAVVTIATVGYGDYTPVTAPGRIIGVVVIITGVAIFGVLASFLSSRFVGERDRVDRENKHAEILASLEKLDRIEAELAALREQVQAK